LALGLMETAGSQLRASPTRSYAACASVATEERQRASDCSTHSLGAAPRGGLAPAPAVRAAAVAACASRAACPAAKSASTRAREGSSAAVAPSLANRSPPGTSAFGAFGAAGRSAAAWSAEAGGGGTTGVIGKIDGAAGSGPTCRGGSRRLMLRGRWGCLVSICQRMPMVDFTTPQTEYGVGP